MFSVPIDSKPDVRSFSELSVLNPKKARKEEAISSKLSTENDKKKTLKQITSVRRFLDALYCFRKKRRERGTYCNHHL
jgi:hypothetical protein